MGGGLLDLIPAHRGHFAYTSGDHGDLWLDLDALFAHPRRLRHEGATYQRPTHHFEPVPGQLARELGDVRLEPARSDEERVQVEPEVAVVA